MQLALYGIVIASAIWMYSDASRLGYDPKDIRGIAAMSPVGWLLSGLLIWIIAFPLYLVKRGDLKAAGERRRGLIGDLSGVPTGTGPLTEAQVADGCKLLAMQRDARLITPEQCKVQQDQLIARRAA